MLFIYLKNLNLIRLKLDYLFMKQCDLKYAVIIIFSVLPV